MESVVPGVNGAQTGRGRWWEGVRESIGKRRKGEEGRRRYQTETTIKANFFSKPWVCFLFDGLQFEGSSRPLREYKTFTQSIEKQVCLTTKKKKKKKRSSVKRMLMPTRTKLSSEQITKVFFGGGAVATR